MIINYGKYDYNRLKDRDAIALLRPILDNRSYYLRDADGRIVPKLESMAHDTPWHHVIPHRMLHCHLWHSIIFNLVASQQPVPFVPAACHECYKVVVRINNVKQLFTMVDIQKALNHPAKCGIEVRPTVHGLYGAYFYNTSKEQGEACWKMVYNALQQIEMMKDCNVFLKRACTEFEMACGPSDKWKITEKQMKLEMIVHDQIRLSDITRVQPDHLIARVHRTWIEWAYANGDPTYKDFTGGKPLYPPYVTYHDHLLKEIEYNADKKKKEQEKEDKFNKDFDELNKHKKVDLSAPLVPAKAGKIANPVDSNGFMEWTDKGGADETTKK